jgi:hypothetical protein
MFPAEGDMPGVADMDAAAYVRKLRAESTFTYWVGVVVGALVFIAAPVITIGWPVPAMLLPAATLDRYADRVAGHPIYLVRQAMLLLKLNGGMLWAAHPTVRAAFGLPAYPPDPGTFRQTGVPADAALKSIEVPA